MAITQRTRFEVLRRDNHTCRYCGASAPDVKLAVDHVLPVALGGSNDPTNLVASCVDCNSGKSSTGPDEHIVAEVDEKALKWAMAREIAKRRASENRERNREIHDKFLTTWTQWDRTGALLPSDWRSTLDRWIRDGMEWVDILDAYEAALGASHVSQRIVYRYMAGVIKRKIADLDNATVAVMESAGHE